MSSESGVSLCCLSTRNFLIWTRFTKILELEIEDQKVKTRVLSENLERIQLGLREQVTVCCKDVRYSNRATQQLEKNMTVNANTPPLKPFLDMMIEEMKKDAGIQSQKFQR